MEFEDICTNCKETKFDRRGVALTRGLKSFDCVVCKGHAVNYPEGQMGLCHACARKLKICVMCGKSLI